MLKTEGCIQLDHWCKREAKLTMHKSRKKELGIHGYNLEGDRFQYHVRKELAKIPHWARISPVWGLLASSKPYLRSLREKSIEFIQNQLSDWTSKRWYSGLPPILRCYISIFYRQEVFPHFSMCTQRSTWCHNRTLTSLHFSLKPCFPRYHPVDRVYLAYKIC